LPSFLNAAIFDYVAKFRGDSRVTPSIMRCKKKYLNQKLLTFMRPVINYRV